MSLLAQRPQGSNQSFTDILTYGSGAVTLTDQGQVFLSSDGGGSYTELFDHTESLFGIGASGQTVIAVGTDGIIFLSDFSIDNTLWTQQTAPAIFGDLRAVASNGASLWLAAGGAVLRSVDSGATWTDTSPGSMTSLHDVIYTGSGSNWVAVGGSFDAEAFYSTDGGSTWTASTLPAFTLPLLAVGVDGLGNILVAGEQGTLLLSTDQGQSFSALTSEVSQDLKGIVSTADDQWLVSGEQRILLSVNSMTDSSSMILIEASEMEEDQGHDIALVGDRVIIAGASEVLAPQITSAETSSFDPIEITLVPGAGSGATYYSMDGGEPDDSDILYSAPFSISDTVTVKAISELEGVYSAVVSEDFTIILHSLSISPDGVDIDLELDTSVVGYSYQLQSNDDLTNNAGWGNAGGSKGGTGSPLDWTITNPSSPLFWQVVITQDSP